MRKEILLIFLLSILIISPIYIIGAETFKEGSDIDFKKTCSNLSGDVCDTTATCNLTIKYPRNNSYVVNNQQMTNNNNGIFNYTISSNDNSVLGKYNWDIFCCDNGNCGESHGIYSITKTGVELSQDKALIYIAMLGVLVVFLVLSIFIISILPNGNPVDEQGYFVDITNLKYLRSVFYVITYTLVLSISFVSSNISYLYLESVMMGDFFFKVFQIMGYLLTPMVFIWFVFIFVNIMKDRELRRMIERGAIDGI